MASSAAGTSTYYFASRYQQNQGTDHAELDDDDASPPSSILQRLRRIEARAAALSPKETHSGRHVSGSTELVWQDKSLVWSRGGQLVRTFTFQHDIVQACWASMGQRSKRSRRQRRYYAGHDDGIESSFSAAQRQMRASWAGGDESAPSSSSHLGPRQLVVILSDAFWVYSPSSGHEYTTAKSFKLAKAWPATTGVFLQRSLEAEDHLDATPQLPTLFYLGHHLDEVTPVAMSSTSGSTVAFTEDVKESIVFVCDQGHSRILVTVRPGAGEIRLYAYAIARHGAPAPQPQPQPRPQRPPFQRQQSTSAANMSRSESAPNNTTSQIGKGRPSMPRRSSRLSSHNTSTVGAPSLKSAPPMTRRRSSRYPSSGGDLGNMSRIDETFNHSVAVGHAGPSSASMAAAAAVNASSAAAITNLEQQEDAVEAEEMGQMVEGLARRKTLPGRAADESLARRPSIGSSRHRRASNLGRSVPYTPRSNLGARLSTGRGRLSRDGIELDFDPMSTSAAAGGTIGGATLAEEDFSQHMMEEKEKEGAAKRDLGAMEHAATAVLQLVDVMRVGSWSDGVQDAVKVLAHEDGHLLQVYVHAQGRLFHRTLRRLNDGRLEVAGQGCVDARGTAAVEVEGGKRQVVLLSGRGTLHLCLEASPSAPILDLALQRNRDVWLLVASRGQQGPAAGSLSSEDGGRLDLKLESGEDVSAAVDFAYSPRNAALQRLLTALETCTTVGAHLRRAWILANASSDASEWDALLQALCGPTEDGIGLDDDLLEEVDTFGLFAKSQPPKKPRTTGLDPALRPEAARILSVLNAVAQDCRLDATSSDLTHLAHVIVQVGAACGARRLVTYWSMLAPTAGMDTISSEASIDVKPADAFQLLAQSCQQPDAHITALGMDERQVAASMPTFARLLRVVQAYSNTARQEERYLSVATAIVREGIVIDRLPWCLWLPLRLVLTHCAQQPLAGVPAQVCRLIERYDLIRPRKETQMRYHSDALRVLPSGPRQLHPLSAMLFSKDYRLHDVVEMLETHRIVYVQAPASTTKTDEELREIGVSLLHNVGERIKASAIGRGMLFFLTRPFRPTLRWDTPPLNRRVLLRPPQPYHHPEPRLDSPEFEWPEFHNGAASALEMVVTGKAKVDSIWYFSQGAGERNARHAGLLLGLGLAGHFATIGQVHTYRYLGDRHGLTSIGLLLGLSATFAGRGDPDVRSLLACHVKAFLPEHSANLAHSTLVQAAALLGTGLLFLGADVSHIAEALCDQIGAQEIETTDPTMLSRAAYSLSAAFGAGLVMLGRGRRCAMTMRDKKLCRKLERYMVGASRDSFAEEMASDLVWRVDERITSSTAAVAYALFFLKSNQPDAARSIPMPKDFVELDAMRPDILLIHSVARNLIMWDDMAPTTQWLESTLPAFLRIRTASPIAMQVKTNIIAGACLALSFKYAGSADAQAKQLLLSVYRDFEEQASRTSKQTYDGRVLYSTLRSSSDIIALALAVVLAGTGDLDLLKILRPAHARVPCSEPYGSHMAIHMAMGLLFLGGGRLTLGTSDASVAAMLIAFYPRFPTRATDNRSHLQAYRHLWVLAVEPRLVVTQDVASGEMACVAIKVRARNGAEMAASTPFQLPHLDHIASISLESTRYEQTTLDSAHRRFQLKRKEGHLDYSRDPRGHRTAMTREVAKEREAVGPKSSAMLAPPSKGEQAMLSPNLRLLLAHARGDERLVSSLRQCVDRNAPSLLALGVALEQLPRVRCPQTIRGWMWAPRFLALLGLEAEPQLEAALESLREAARRELGVAEVRGALLSGAAADERLAFVLAALAPGHAVEELRRLREMMGEAAEVLKREGIADHESVVEALVDVGRAATRGEVDGELIKTIAGLAA